MKRPDWAQELTPGGGSPRRYAVCLAVVLAAGAFQLLYDGYIGQNAPFLLLYPAMMFCALYGGLWPAVLATLVGMAIAWWGFLPDALPLADRVGRVLIFDATAAITITLSAFLQSARNRATHAHGALQSITDTMDVPVTRCNKDLHYVWVSRTYAEWIGRRPEDIVGRPLVEVLGGEVVAAIRPYVDRVLAGEDVEYEQPLDIPGKGMRWVHASYRPTYAASGVIDGWVAVVHDFTARKADENALREEGRRRDQFLAMLAHELRNPLAPIRNAAEVLGMPGLSDVQMAGARDIIQRQVAHLARLLDDLLDISRVSQGKITLVYETVDLADVLREAAVTVQPLVDRHQQTLFVAMPTEPICVRGDRTRLVQIFDNLLHNATKFTPPGGRITLASERRNGAIAVHVRDTGVGMAPDSLERVFDLFVQEAQALDRSLGGLGLGLTLVRKLVNLHGGHVTAFSAGAGQGSQFTVTLPVSPRAAHPVQPPASVTPARPLRVLVVEDNADAAASFVTLLEVYGHEVRCAADGVAALDMPPDFVPDVAFIDLGLPGVDGYDVARLLRQRATWSGTMFVALSGYGRDEDKRRSAAAGFDRHLTKPVDPREVTAVLASCAATPVQRSGSAPSPQ